MLDDARGKRGRAAAVDAKCLELEQSTAKPPLEALDGAWRVVYSNAPSPSNGALGPLRGDQNSAMSDFRTAYLALTHAGLAPDVLIEGDPYAPPPATHELT